MTYIVDEPLAELVLDRIWARYVSGEYPYNQSHVIPLLPQTHLPPSLELGGSDEAWYWMIVCLWMRTTNTGTAAKQVAQLYEYCATHKGRNPFNPMIAAIMKPQRVGALIKQVGLGLDDTAPEHWVENAIRLVMNWQGNPLRIFKDVTSYEEVAPRLMNDPAKRVGFAGFQHKMASMLLYFLSERELIAPFPFPPPIDFHLMRIAAETGIIRREDGSTRLAYSESDYSRLGEILREMYFSYALRHGLPGNRFNDALWLLSKRLCRHNPGNRCSVAKEDANGGTGRKRIITHYLPDWKKQTDVNSYRRSCGSCPIESLCLYNVPSADRYIAGELRTSILRERPPDDPNSLFPYYIGRIK
jgi:hypothetical protein